MLLEMFPDSCTLEITHCLGLSKGNLETAAQLVLERAEEGTSIKRPKVSLYTRRERERERERERGKFSAYIQ